MKLDIIRINAGCQLVAPHAGAWIETDLITYEGDSPEEVAPHAGAWIETVLFQSTAPQLPRRPPRGGVD